MMHGYGFGFMWFWGFLGLVITVGLAFLVWILVIKFWKELNKRR